MILVIDNYDSFTYNLVQYIGALGEEVEVRRNDAITLPEIVDMDPDGILLSPGPCRPESSGICLEIAEAALSSRLSMPIFGVCLGHQAIGLVAGSKVAVADHIRHGKTSPVSHDGRNLFEGLPQPFQATRYHSLIVESPPTGFEVTANATDDNAIMGFRHQSLPIESVQFHPESILTEQGDRIVLNFVRQVRNGG